MKRKLILLSAAALAAGCVAGPYQPPEGPQTARLTVTNASGDVVAIYTFEDAQACERKLALHPRAGVSMGDSYSVRIATGTPFTLSAVGTNAPPNAFGYTGAARCAAAGTFVPQPGRTYVALFRGTGNQCQLQVGVRQEGSTSQFVFEASYRNREDSGCR